MPPATLAAPSEYDDSPSKAQEITPLAQAQMREGELIVQLSMAIHRLGDRLRPLMSEEAQKIEGGNRLVDTDKRPSLGSSPTITMIEQQCENLEGQITMVKSLTRYLEV